MAYDSTITFTLDTICPWTYIGFVRLNKALSNWNAANPDSPVTFTLKLAPYQLYPDFSQEGEDKYEWYLREKYNNQPERMKMYTTYMTTLGAQDSIPFSFSGKIANTLHAHRILTYLQTTHSPDVALAALSSFYTQYMTQNAHPSSPETLKKACVDAGVGAEEAEKLVSDQDVGMREVKKGLREQVGNAVDSVPYVVFEGKRRDFTLVGAKEVPEYEKVLGQVVKEAA